MENFKEIKTFVDLIDILNTVIPDGVNKDLEVNGNKITLNKEDGIIKISLSSNMKDTTEEFDDSNVKEIIKEYKEWIEELDDCLFVEATEETSKHFNIKRFDELLNKDSFTKEEAYELSEMIDKSSQIICKHLENKIAELIDIYNRF